LPRSRRLEDRVFLHPAQPRVVQGEDRRHADACGEKNLVARFNQFERIADARSIGALADSFDEAGLATSRLPFSRDHTEAHS
jgi:hypothetical protein